LRKVHWNKVTLAADAESLDGLETLLWDLGSVSVTVTDSEDRPIYEPGPGETPLWSKMEVTGLFEEDVDQDEVSRQLASAGYQILFQEELGDRPWEREWLSRFHAVKFGSRLWVCPTGEEVTEPGAVVMHLDPGLAFGTGSHATTQLCLEWLGSNNMQGKKVIDYGSGSGILGIAALLLGADEVLAVDNDPQALRATRDNAIRNNVSERLRTSEPGNFEALQADVVIANILAQPLIDLSDHLISLLKVDGDLLLSGIMESQQHWVESAYEKKASFIGRQLEDGWLCLQARK
jgi:ribosomal protein L11 methyltransferase